MSLKVEIVNVCFGCLSSDRNLTALGELSDIFHIIKPQTCIYDNVLLCWECRSILKKTWRFQQRVQQAQILMQTPEFIPSYSTSCLSTLQSKVIDNCEIVHKSYKENKQEVKLETEKKICKIDSDVDYKFYDDLIEEEIKDEKNKQLNKTFSNFEVKIYDEEIKNESKEKIVDKEINQSIKRKRKIEIEITPQLKKIELKDKLFDYIDEDFYNECNEEIVDKKILEKKNKQLIKKKYNSENRRSGYRRIVQINENTLNLERFYVISEVNEKVIEEVLEGRVRIKYSGKERHKCTVCDMKFYKKIDLRRHKTLKHIPKNGPYKCCECIHKCKSISDLHKHWRKHKVYRCCLCPNSFITNMQLIRHLRLTHAYIYQCLECKTETYRYHDLFKHYQEAHNQRICDYCGKTFKTKKLIEEHMMYQHLPRVCDICGHVCKSGHGLSAHKSICRPDKHFDVAAVELSYCVECNKQYDSIEKYRTHLRSAVAHNPSLTRRVKVPCPDCGKVFTKKIYMSNHYKLKHLSKSDYYCEICNKYFISGYSLRTHRKSVHEKKYPPKNKTCDTCGRGFRTNRLLIQHKRTHTGERPYQCSYCPAAFSQITARKTHQRTQHKVI